MKKLLTLATFATLASGMAFAQTGTLATQTSSKACSGNGDAAGACYVSANVTLYAVKPEGLTLTVPREIDFVLVDGQLNYGNQPLTATTTWDLPGYESGGAAPTNIVVNAYFLDPTNALQLNSDGTKLIAAAQVISQLGGAGAQLPFAVGNQNGGDTFNVPSTSANRLIYSTPIIPTAGGASQGSHSADLNLAIDTRTGTPAIPATQNGDVYQGTVTVVATAI